MEKVSVAILNFNGKNYLENFLPNLINHTPCEIIIIDNCSTDDSIQFVKENYPEIKIIRLEQNYGFSDGYNRGLKKIKSTYYILLNSDVEVTPGWLEPLINILDTKPEVAACQPKILSQKQKHLFEYAGAAGGFIDKLGYPFCRGRIFNTVEEDKGQYDDEIRIFWASGACLCIRADKFWEAGGFDTDFFAHMEEIDLCWRLNNDGYQIVYTPQSKVYHLGGGTLESVNPKKTYYNFRNGLSLLLKNLPVKELLWKMPVRLVLDGIASIKFLFSGGISHFLAVFQAHLHFYAHISKNISKRKKIKRIGYIKDIPIYKRLIVWDYFIGKRRYFSELNKKENLSRE